MRALVLIAGVAFGLVAGGCGDGSKAPAVPGGADPDDVAVIDGWAEALRAGDIEKAATYWAIPALAQNGTPPLALGSTAEVLRFNEALPCGADLIAAEPEEQTPGLILATFELTDRAGPGAGCGGGVGSKARTEFEITDGKISVWTRAPNPPEEDGEPGAPPAPGTSV